MLSLLIGTVVAVVGRESITVNETTNRVTVTVRTVRIKLSSGIAGGHVDLGEVTNTC